MPYIKISDVRSIPNIKNEVNTPSILSADRLRRCRSIELETEVLTDQRFEDERTGEGETKYNPWALKCHRDNLKKMGINLVKVT